MFVNAVLVLLISPCLQLCVGTYQNEYYTATSRVENSAQVLYCKLNFVRAYTLPDVQFHGHTSVNRINSGPSFQLEMCVCVCDYTPFST